MIQSTPVLTVAQLALLFGIKERAMRRGVRLWCAGKMYKGLRLPVSHTWGRGGCAGFQPRVELSSLPSDLQMRVVELWPEFVPEHSVVAVSTSKPRTRGKDKRPRVLIGRDWDRGIRLPQELKAAIAANLDGTVRSLWASTAGQIGWRRVRTYASQDLFDFCREAGAELPDQELRALCIVPERYVRDWDRRKHRKVNIYRDDAKAFHDVMPGVERQRPQLPLDVVIGDGTPLDINFLRPDGSQWKIWLILWLDAATNRLFGHVYARPKGRGVRQEHVALSYQIFASEIGLPKTLYVDRGGEYAWTSMLESAGLARVVKALPYNARAKPIEPVIRVLGTNFLSQIPGYMGSDRMDKKTQAVGKPTKPFPGSIQALFAAIEKSLDHYNATAQEGLGGVAPDQLWQSALDAGWCPTQADLATLSEAVCRREIRTVKRGAIQIKSRLFTSDALCCDYALEGEPVIVMVPVARGFPPAIYDPKERFVGLVYEKPRYEITDLAGAKEAGRVKTMRRQGASALERTAPPADVSSYQRMFLEHHPAPEGAAADKVLHLYGERGRAAEARRKQGLFDHNPNAKKLPAHSEEPDYIEMMLEIERKRGQR